MPEKKIADVHLHCRFLNYEKTCAMLDSLTTLGVTDTCFQALPYRSAGENLFILYLKMTCKEPRVRAFCGLHVTDRYAKIPPEKQVEGLLALGSDGIKLMFSPDLERYYGRGIDDPYYDAMFTLLEERDVPVLIHLADPETFWDEDALYSDPSFPSKEQQYEEAFRMLDKHPRLRVCFAHFMFLSNFPEEAARIMETYPNVSFDLTPGTEMYYNFDKQLETWRAFFKKYSHRLLFGTDCNTIKSCNLELEKLVFRKLSEKGTFTQRCYGRDFTVDGFGFEDDVLERICYENYFSFIGKESVPVNESLFYDCCRRIKDDLDSIPNDEEYIKGGELIPDLKNDPSQRIAYDFCQMALAAKQKT